MHTKILSLFLVSTLALAAQPARTLAADPGSQTAVEAADRQFLTALETGQPPPATSSHAGTVEAPRATAPVATGPASAPFVTKEAAPAPKSTVATVKKAPAVKREEPRRKTAAVEVRRAIPVPVSTATKTTTSSSLSSSVGLEDDEDRDHEDHDGDDNDHSDGFFHRLFRGEKIFR